jgi:hypothetical protein
LSYVVVDLSCESCRQVLLRLPGTREKELENKKRN